MVNFTGASSQFLSLPDGTVPFGNSEYTVILVSKPRILCNCAVLASGEYGSPNNRSNTFRYDSSGKFQNYWWYNDINIAKTFLVNKNNLIIIIYNQSERKAFADGSLINTKIDTTPRISTQANNRIARSSGSGEYFTGDIGEIIIYDRALNNSERKDIENYLAKKWEIKI